MPNTLNLSSSHRLLAFLEFKRRREEDSITGIPYSDIVRSFLGTVSPRLRTAIVLEDGCLAVGGYQLSDDGNVNGDTVVPDGRLLGTPLFVELDKTECL